MKIQYIIRLLVLGLTVVSTTYGMKQNPIVSESEAASQGITDYNQYVVDQTMINEADLVTKVALQATHGDEIDKEVARANNAVDTILLQLPENERDAMRQFWNDIFYDPVSVHTGDIASRIIVIQKCFADLSTAMKENMDMHILGNVLRDAVHAQSTKAGNDVEDGEGDDEDGEGDFCQVS